MGDYEQQVALTERDLHQNSLGSEGVLSVPSLNPGPPIVRVVRSIYLVGAVTTMGPRSVEVGWRWFFNKEQPEVFYLLRREGLDQDGDGTGPNAGNPGFGSLALGSSHTFRIRQNPGGDDPKKFRLTRNGALVAEVQNKGVTSAFVQAGAEANDTCDSLYGSFTDLRVCRIAGQTCDWQSWDDTNPLLDRNTPWWKVVTYETAAQARIRHCDVPDCPNEHVGAQFLGGDPPPTCDEEWTPQCAEQPQPPPPPPPPAWSGWEIHPGAIDSGIDAAAWRGSNWIGVFARDEAGNLVVRWWDGASWNPDGLNGGWANMGPIVDASGDEIPLVGDPAASSWGTGRLDVFARGADDRIWWRSWEGTYWTGWRDLGAPTVEDVPGVPVLETTAVTSSPDAVSLWPGHVSFFARGPDNALWHRYYIDSNPSDGTPGAWSVWENLGGNLASDPSAASWWGDRLDVFAKGGEGRLYTRSWTAQAGWSPNWTPLGGHLASGPDAVSWGVGRIDVFARGIDNHLYQKTYRNGSWIGWADLGGRVSWGGTRIDLRRDPAAASWGEGRLDVFARTSEGFMVHKWCDVYPGCPEPGWGQMPASVPEDEGVEFVGASYGVGWAEVGVPSNLEEEDIVLAFLTWEAASAAAHKPPVPPAGWHLIRADIGPTCAQAAYWHRVDDPTAEPSNYSFSEVVGGVGAAVSVAYRGADPDAPVISSSGQGTGEQTLSAPSIMAEAGSRLVFAWGRVPVVSATYPPMGMTTRYGDSSPDGRVRVAAADELSAGTGFTGERETAIPGIECGIAQLVSVRPSVLAPRTLLR